MRFFSFTLCIAYFCAAFLVPHVYADPPAGKSWRLVFFDDFNAENSDLDARWDFQNGPNSHILCSRWRENATVENGVLKLMNRKESRGGQEWTSASMWTKRKFLYGYFEARYKYSAATGTNNSFWLITTGSIPEGKSRYEIDINEGHYPSEINTNLHNWSDTFVNPDGSSGHVGSSKAFEMSESDNFAPWASFECVNGVLTSKIRFLRGPYRYFHLREIRIFGSSASGYQDPKIADYSSKFPALSNIAYKRQVYASGTYNDADSLYAASNAVDNSRSTDWTSNTVGDKWLVVELDSPTLVKCVQTYTGWGADNNDYIGNFQIQYLDSATNSWLPFPNTAGIHHFYNPVEGRRFRLRANTKEHFHIREFRIYKTHENGYPSAYIDTSSIFPNAENVAKQGAALASGTYDDSDPLYNPSNAIDGKIGTSWCSQRGEGEKWFEVDLPQKVSTDCIQIVTGWRDSASGAYVKYLEDYVLEYFDEDKNEWKVLSTRSTRFPSVDFSAEYHIYGLEWNSEELVYYFDDKPIRRIENTGYSGASAGICDTASPVYLSAAIAEFSGAVTDAIDGTSMDVDWVKIYSPLSEGDTKISYDAWAVDQELSGKSALPDSVNAPSGETNLARYAFRLDSTLLSAKGGGFEMIREDGSINFFYRVASYVENVSFSLQVSDDLKTWSDVSARVEKTHSDSDYSYYKAYLTDTYLGKDVFLRLKLATAN